MTLPTPSISFIFDSKFKISLDSMLSTTVTEKEPILKSFVKIFCPFTVSISSGR